MGAAAWQSPKGKPRLKRRVAVTPGSLTDPRREMKTCSCLYWAGRVAVVRSGGVRCGVRDDQLDVRRPGNQPRIPSGDVGNLQARINVGSKRRRSVVRTPFEARVHRHVERDFPGGCCGGLVSGVGTVMCVIFQRAGLPRVPSRAHFGRSGIPSPVWDGCTR